jgi:hypothetical protein
MKRKTKRYADEGLVEDDISRAIKVGQKPDVEAMKQGIAAGAPAEPDEITGAKNLAFEPDRVAKPKPRPRPAPTASSAESSNMQNASDTMKKGLAGERPTQRMTNAPLDKLKADRKIAAFNAERKAAAEERKKTARSTTSAIPYDSVNPNQYKMFEKDSYAKGGKVKSASARADGCAIRGKTRA